jgi:hypothetical protein
MELAEQGIKVCVNTVAKLMKQAEIRSIMQRRFVVQTTDSNHDRPVADNLLERDFHAEKPDQKWCCDITYVPTDEGFLYVAAVMDLCSRRIVGWSMADHLRTQLCLDALNSALKSRKPGSDLMHHSDRGRAVRQQRLSATATIARYQREHEPPGRLLRQRDDGKFLGHAEEGTGASPELFNPGRGQTVDLQIHRVLVQSPETSLCDRLQKPRTVRGEPQLTKWPPRPPFVGKSKSGISATDGHRFTQIRKCILSVQICEHLWQ